MLLSVAKKSKFIEYVPYSRLQKKLAEDDIQKRNILKRNLRNISSFFRHYLEMQMCESLCAIYLTIPHIFFEFLTLHLSHVANLPFSLINPSAFRWGLSAFIINPPDFFYLRKMIVLAFDLLSRTL